MFGCCRVRALTDCCKRSSRSSSHTSNWISTRTKPLRESGGGHEDAEDTSSRMVLDCRAPGELLLGDVKRPDQAERHFKGADIVGGAVVDAGAQPVLPLGNVDFLMNLDAGVLEVGKLVWRGIEGNLAVVAGDN